VGAAIVIVLYLTTFVRFQRSDLVDYWSAAGGYPVEAGGPPVLSWYLTQGWGLLQYLFAPVAAVALVLILLGLSSMAQRSASVVCLLAGPLLLAVVSSAAGGYPFNSTTGGRLILFGLPGLLIIAIYGFRQLHLPGRASLAGKVLAATAIAALCLPSIAGQDIISGILYGKRPRRGVASSDVWPRFGKIPSRLART
jgi:hypothetical protein